MNHIKLAVSDLLYSYKSCDIKTSKLAWIDRSAI